MSAATAYLFVWEFITEELFALLNNIMIQTLYNSFEISVRVLAMWEREEEEVNFEKTYGGIFNSCY